MSKAAGVEFGEAELYVALLSSNSCLLVLMSDSSLVCLASCSIVSTVVLHFAVVTLASSLFGSNAFVCRMRPNSLLRSVFVYGCHFVPLVRSVLAKNGRVVLIRSANQ